MKSRGLYETPGGTVLYEAINHLQALVLDRDTLHTSEQLGLRFAELCYYGKWFCPEREALQAFFEKANEVATGEVTVELYKGQATALTATSPFSLYREDLAPAAPSAPAAATASETRVARGLHPPLQRADGAGLSASASISGRDARATRRPARRATAGIGARRRGWHR